jgi:hypothetical protein
MIRDWVAVLLTLTGADWGRYAFSLDPLARRITPEQQEEHRRKTEQSALELANGLRARYAVRSPEQFARQLGLTLDYRSEAPAGGLRMFASFEEPATITVYTDNITATDRLLREENLYDLVGEVQAADVLVAHELYHFLEQDVPGVYSAQKHLLLWKLGPFQNRSRILCLEEIGAMAFARELSGLKCSAYIFEVLLLYSHNPQKARQLYEHFMKISAKKEVSA